MKRHLLWLCMILFAQLSFSQLVITEIMYNPPESGDDSTEYIEILNISQNDIQLLNYSISQGIDMVFGNIILASGAYLVVTKNTESFASYYGFEAIQWDGGSLSNSGEQIVLENAFGDRVDVVNFDDQGGWPVGADGQGFSLELCDPYRDNSVPENWKQSMTSTGLIIDGKQLFASPGMPNEIDCDDLINHTVDVLSLQFDPKHLTIFPGETVQWINNSGSNHNVNGSLSAYPDNPEGFYSGAPSNDNWVFSHTFTIPGSYKYKCDLHAILGMTGTIEVLPEEASKLLFTEIMYNDPGNGDSLEFIEIHNIGPAAIELGDFVLKGNALEFTFPPYSIAGGEYLVLCRDSMAFADKFGFPAMSWEAGSLGNNGDELKLLNRDGIPIDEVSYDDDIPWPTLGDGYGHSISLCRPDLDNSIPENWQETPVSSGVFIGGIEVFANPGKANYCGYDIGEINQINADGTLVFDNLGVELHGTVYGINLKPGALQCTLIDDLHDGIALFSSGSNFGYEVMEGNQIIILGKTGQYNGLAQIYLDTVLFFGHHKELFEPTVVTMLDESTESQLVTLQNVSLVNTDEWGLDGPGFNVQVTDGVNNYSLRIDNDVDVFMENYPTGTFHVTGIGGQFDSAPPYLDGYELWPRYMQDFDPFLPYQYPEYTIGQVTTVDIGGVADSMDVKCALTGVVYGINLHPDGLNFTLIDENNDGINVFSEYNSFGYEVLEGDQLKIKGIISQYNGLLEIIPEKIELISSGNPLFDVVDVTELNEETESQLIKIANLNLVNPTEWKGDGSDFSVEVSNGTASFVLLIDKDCTLSTMEGPEGAFHATGIGSQFDPAAPYAEGYQLVPRYAADIDLADQQDGIYKNQAVEINPNPVRNVLSIFSGDEIRSVTILDMHGRRIDRQSLQNNRISVMHLAPGVYHFIFEGMKQQYHKKVVKF